MSLPPTSQPDEPTPEPPQELIFEFDTLTYNPMPHWHEIPLHSRRAPDGVTDKRTANMSLNLGEEVSVTLTVEKAGTYALVLHAVTNTNGPVLQFAVNGQDVGGKVKMVTMEASGAMPPSTWDTSPERRGEHPLLPFGGRGQRCLLHAG